MERSSNVTEMRIVKVQMHDTGIGREAGYRDDADLIEHYQYQRNELEKLLTPETLAKIDAAEAALTRRIVLGH